VAAALLLLLSLVCAVPGHAAGNTPIFVLHSYSQEYPWTKRQHEGFMRKLGAAVPGTIAAHVEYLDTKRAPYTAAYADFFASYLAQKYAGFEPKFIYVTDDNALLFALAHLTRIFPKVPIFFSGINDFGMRKQIDPGQVTGVFENKEIEPNLELMRELAPGERDILVLGDASGTFQAIHREMVFPLAHHPEIRAQFLSSGSIEQLVASLRGRKERFAFLTTLGEMTDAKGHTLTLPETIAAIVQAGRFIIISMEDVYLYPGVLGGYVTSGLKQGEAAAGLAARYLAGTPVAAIKPIESSPNEYIIDGGELDTLGLTLPAELAAQATILNRPPTFYERNLKLIVPALYALASLFVVSLAAFAYGLARKNRQIARASKELALHSDQLRRVIEGFPVVLWAIDGDGIFTFSRGAGLKPLGLAPDEVVGKSLFEIYRDSPSVIAATRRALAGESLMAINWVGPLAFETHYAPLLDARGAVTGATGVSTDVTERKRAEAALQESEERYRTLIDWTPEAIAVHRNGILLYVNPAAVRMIGAKSARDLLGKPLLDWVHPDFRNIVLARVEHASEQDVATPLTEGKFVKQDGTLMDVEVQRTPIAYDGGSAIQVAMRDITERKQAEAVRASLEAQLRESQKMEALGTLAGGVAHDFNNALAAITGNVELARQDVGQSHPAQVSLEEIAKASRRAKDLVQQILAFGRRQKLERKATSLALVVMESARLMRATLPASVSLNVDCKADTPAVLADATQIKQILLNLCGNALQAIQDQARPGVIDVRLAAYDSPPGEARADLPPGRYACLTVQDDGSGMDEATRARIFDPFFTTKPVGKGTGLGLAVVYGIVQAHEARIEAQSAPGAGTTFRIYFPATDLPPQDVAAPAADTAPVEGLGKHILYVDDEDAIIFLMKRLLERQGYRVSGYTDPREALAAARADPAQFDLVVTDYNMPGLSGLDVAHALKVIRPDLPVVLASGYITEELRALAPAAGVCGLIYKPNTVDELCAAVARFANAQSEVQSAA